MAEVKNVPFKYYLYFYSCYEEELALCRLEMRRIFGFDTDSKYLQSIIKFNPSRSPFMKGRLEVLYESPNISSLLEQIKKLNVRERSFKVVYIKNPKLMKEDELPLSKRQQLIREMGISINGNANLESPEQLFGIIKSPDGWMFGIYTESKPVWHKHQKKPFQYSTALNTRTARAIVNIAVPNVTKKIKVIDPCCGIGTVLVEALSMGIHIKGSDINPLVMKGARGNIAYFGYTGEVRIKDIRDINVNYDVAIVDMPYNLCSVLEETEQLEMLKSARKFTKILVVITVESIDPLIKEAGFQITDRCSVNKGKHFTREIIICK